MAFTKILLALSSNCYAYSFSIKNYASIIWLPLQMALVHNFCAFSGENRLEWAQHLMSIMLCSTLAVANAFIVLYTWTV